MRQGEILGGGIREGNDGIVLDPIPTRALSATSRNSLDASGDGDPSHSDA